MLVRCCCCFSSRLRSPPSGRDRRRCRILRAKETIRVRREKSLLLVFATEMAEQEEEEEEKVLAICDDLPIGLSAEEAAAPSVSSDLFEWEILLLDRRIPPF